MMVSGIDTLGVTLEDGVPDREQWPGGPGPQHIVTGPDTRTDGRRREGRRRGRRTGSASRGSPRSRCQGMTGGTEEWWGRRGGGSPPQRGPRGKGSERDRELSHAPKKKDAQPPAQVLENGQPTRSSTRP